MAKITAVGLVKQAVGFNADQVTKNKVGNVVVRLGYFYRNGNTAESFAEQVVRLCRKAGLNPTVVEVNDFWKPFRGGATLANQSHFYVELSM